MKLVSQNPLHLHPMKGLTPSMFVSLYGMEVIDNYATRMKADRNYVGFSILGNGLELRELIRVDKRRNLLIHYANQLYPDFVLLPDHPENPNNSYKLAVSASSSIPTQHRMVIPHGDSAEDMFANLKLYIRNMPFAGIAVPQLPLTERKLFLEMLRRTGLAYQAHVHLLGLSDGLNEIKTLKHLAHSVSTWYPFSLAQENISLWDTGTSLVNKSAPTFKWHGYLSQRIASTNYYAVRGECDDKIFG